MENQNSISPEENLNDSGTSVNVVNKAEPYMTAESLFETQQYGPDFLNMADPAALLNVDRYQQDMFKYGPEVIGNISSPIPGLVDIGYNPSKNNISDLSPVDKLALLADAPSEFKNVPATPEYANIKASNFDRYYAHRNFNELGFHPFKDNESIYNANSSKYDDFVRAWNQVGEQFGVGFGSGYRSIMDAFDGDGYFNAPDIYAANTMEDAMRIGSTSKGGAFGLLTNTGLSFGYTAGIIANIAVEELVLAMGSAALASTGVGAPAGFAAFVVGTGRILATGGKRIANLFDVTRYVSASHAAVKTANNADNARQLYNGGAEAFGRFFAPELTAAVKNWKTTGNTTQNLFNISKSGNAFGAVYRDFRQLNIALSEAKLEAAMVSNRVEQDYLKYLNQQNPGSPITADQLSDAKVKAAQAAFRTQMQNFGIIYLSNKFVLRGAFGSWNRTYKNARRKVFRSNPLVNPKTGRAQAAKISTKGSFLPGLGLPSRKAVMAKFRAVGTRAAPRALASGMLRYGASGLAEGLQEVSQEAIAATNEGYYGALLREPGAATKNLYGTFAVEGMKEQLSQQGLTTFMSGFLMGGLAGPFQTAIFQGIPNIYALRSKASRADFKKQKTAEETVINEIISDVEYMSEQNITKDGDGIMDQGQLFMSAQKQTSDAMDDAIERNDHYDYKNQRNFSEFHNLYRRFENGSIGMYRKDLIEYSNFTDEDLSTAYPPADYGSVEKVRKKIQKQLNLINEYGEMYNNKAAIFKPRYAPELLTPGTRAYKDEVNLKRGYEHTKMFYMFTQNAFKDAFDRKLKIAQKLEATQLYGNMAAGDVTPLLDKESLQLEIDRLNQEISILEQNSNNTTGIDEVTVKRNKKDLTNKKNKKNKLDAINKVYNANLTKNKFFDQRKKNKLKGPIESYLNSLAKVQGTYVNAEAVGEALDEIVDYAALSQDTFLFNNTIDYLLDPNKAEDLIERNAEYFRQLGQAKNVVLANQVTEQLNLLKINGLINDLAAQDVYLTKEASDAFLKSGDITDLDPSKSYIFAGRLLDISVVEDLIIFKNNILPGLENYTRLTSAENTPTITVDDIVADSKDVISQALEDISVDVIPTVDSPILARILESEFRDYQAIANQESLNSQDWKEGVDGQKIQTAYDAIKSIWAAGTPIEIDGEVVKTKPTESDVKDETGFQKFLNGPAIDNPDIINILEKLNLNLSIFQDQVKAAGQNIIFEGVIVDVKENTISQTDIENTSSYSILDKKGNIISENFRQIIGSNSLGVYSNKAAAIQGAEKIEAEADTGGVYRFGGVNGIDLSLNERIINRYGQVFIVNSGKTAYEKSNKNGIFIIPFNKFSNDPVQNKENADFIALQDFINEDFKPAQPINFTSLGKSYYKLRPDEVVEAWSHRNAFTEPKDSADARTNFIIKNLSEEDIKGLNIIIKPGPVKSSTNYPAKPFLSNDMKANPYIIENTNAYLIGIQIIDKDVKKRIDKLIKENTTITALEESANGVFSYLPSDRYNFIDKDENPVMAQNFDVEFMKSVIQFDKNLMGTNIDFSRTNMYAGVQTLKYIQTNIANAAILQQAVVDKLNEDAEGQTLIGDLGKGIQLKIFNGYDNYTKPNTFTQLQNLDYSSDGLGNYIIYDIDLSGDRNTPDVISNLSGNALTELQDTIEATLKGNGVWREKIVNATNRYMVVLKQDNGVYSVVTSRPKTQAKLEVDKQLLRLISRSQSTVENNLDKNNKPKNKNYNKVFNKDTPKKLFIKSSVAGRTFYLDVDQYGNIKIRVTDVIPLQNQTLGSAVSQQSGKVQRLYPKDLEMGIPDETKKSARNLIQPLLNKINIDLGEGTISFDNFGTSIPEDAPIKTFLEDLETAINPSNLRIGQKLMVIANPKEGERETNKGNIATTTSLENQLEGIQLDEDVLDNVKPLEEVSQLSKVLEDIKKLKEEISSSTTNKRQAFKDSTELQALLKKRDLLRGAFGRRSANKIVFGQFDINDVENIDAFSLWASQNLPEFISIADILTLKTNLVTTGTRVGSFVLDVNDIAGGLDVTGKIYTGPNSPFRYHEAFHGVYRMLLTPAEQANYLRIASKEKRSKLRAEGKTLSSELQKFRNSSSVYTNMSQKRLEREYFEEYIADEFELFKTGPLNTNTSSEIKSLFTRIIEYIKAILNRFSRNELGALFQNIDSGKYQSAPIVSNEFTDGTMGSTLQADKLIPYQIENRAAGTGELYIPSFVANGIISSMAGILMDRRFNFVPEGNVEFNIDNQLDIIIDEFYNTYDVDSEVNSAYLPGSKEHIMLEKLTLAFDDFTPQIKQSVQEVLDIIDLQSASQVERNESFEQNEGLRTVQQYGKETYLSGGLDNLSAAVRKYIGTVTYAETDYFGNTTLVNGTPIRVPVNANTVYNGILKALEGLESPVEMMQAMYSFSQTNAQTEAVVNQIFESSGIIMPEHYVEDFVFEEFPQGLSNTNFLIKILNSFTNFRVDWFFTQRDLLQNSIIHSASQRDDSSTQINSWAEAYSSRIQLWQDDSNVRAEALKSLARIGSNLRNSSQQLSNKDLNKNASNLANELYNSIGIRLSPGYMAYSMLKSRSSHTKAQQKTLSFNQNAIPLTTSNIKVIKTLIEQGVDLFKPEGTKSKLSILASNNSQFDETIGATVHKNSNGDLVNSHQQPTYNLRKTKALNSSTERLQLLNNQYLSNNFLLNSQAFNNLADNNQIKITRVSGTKVVKNLAADFDVNQSMVIKTMDYGKFTSGEFLTNVINQYLAYYNTLNNTLLKSVLVQSETNDAGEMVAISPNLIRVMEASNTGDQTTLPIVKAVEKVNGKTVITDEVLNGFYDFIENEYNRIVRENSNERTTDQIIGYNVEDKDGNKRAFQFANNESLLQDDTVSALIAEALSDTPKSFSGAISKTLLKKQLDTNLNNQFDDFNTLIDTLDVRLKIDKKIISGLTRGLSGVAAENANTSAEQYNLLTNDPVYNLKQIFFNGYLNVKSLNEIYMGDQSRTLKDFTDKSKRAKGNNNAFIPAQTFFTDPSLGVMHETNKINLVTLSEPTQMSALSENNIDISDAQVYGTVKTTRHIQFGIGEMTPALASVLDKIEAGEVIEWDLLPELIQQGTMMNSKKYAYFDGETYIKMSYTMLSKELTSIQDSNGNWIAKPNSVRLHNLRVKLEQQSVNNTISIAAPLSALKMLKKNVNDSVVDLSSDQNGFSNDASTISAKYFGLQQINPSNKKLITLQSQMKTIVTSGQIDKSETMNKVIDSYNDKLKFRSRFKYNNKVKLTFNTDDVKSEINESAFNKIASPNLILFSDYAVNSLKASQSSSNLIEFFTRDDNNQLYNLDNPYTVSKYEQLFLTYFSKEVFQEKVNGTSVSLVSSFGKNIYRRVYSVELFNGKVVPDRHEVIRESIFEKGNFELSSQSLEDLQGISIPAEGVIIVDRLRYNIKEYKNGEYINQRYSEAILPPQSKETNDMLAYGDMANIPSVVGEMFSVRIPSEDYHSAFNTKVVDFLPNFMGASAMFSNELVEVSGADFDIDQAYLHRKEYYVENNNFIEYNDNYSDYVNYVNKKVNERGNVYSQALKLFNIQGVTIEDSLVDIDETSSKKAGFSTNAIDALKVLKLPITKTQYNNYIDKNKEAPYEGSVNNSLVELKRTLVSNDGLTSGAYPVAYRPSNLQQFSSVWESVRQIPGFTERTNQAGKDIDNYTGQTIAFTNNKGASIGSVVSPNLYLSLFKEYNIGLGTLNFKLNGETYTNFGGELNKEGIRKQDIMSSLIVLHTDNTKEFLVSKLGLNSHATRMLANMIQLGIPLETSILLLNQNIIQGYYRKLENNDEQRMPSIKNYVGDLLATTYEKETAVDPTLDILKSGVSETTATLKQYEKGVLQVFNTIMSISNFTVKLNSIVSLSNGLGSNIDSIGERLDTMKTFIKNPYKIRVKEMMSQSYVEGLYEQLKDLHNTLLPTMFLSQSSVVKKIKQELVSNLDPNIYKQNENVRLKVDKDILSYITLQTYQNNNINNNPLMNGLIYPGQDNEQANIWNAINKLREADPGNFFLFDFVTTYKPTDVGNRSGLYLAQANTWRKLNRMQKYDLQTSFNKLYNDLNTRDYAKVIIDYMMVKDGLQLSPGSLLESMSPYVLEDYLSDIKNTENFLKGTAYEELGGDNYFIDNYLRSASVLPMLPTYSTPTFKPRIIRVSDFDVVTLKETNFRLNDQAGNSVEIMGSPAQFGAGFMFGNRPTQKQMQGIETNTQETGEVKAPQSNIKTTVAPEVFRDQSTNIVADENGIIIGGSNIANKKKMDELAADRIDATTNISTESKNILMPDEIPVSEKTNTKISQLSIFDPSVSHPEITKFWNNNIENGTFTTEIKNFKKQNNIDSIEELVDLYDNDPNSMWNSPQDLIDQIKKCNL